MVKDPLYIFLMAAFLIIGVPLLLFGGFSAYGDYKATKWPSVDGVVVRSSVNSITIGRYFPDIFYRYSVGGKTYTNNAIGSGPGVRKYPIRSDARRVVERLPENSTVKVYYNPDDPSEAMLEPGISGSSVSLALLGIALAAAGLFVLIEFIILGRTD